MLEQKRLTAIKVKISDITNGDYKVEEGFTPNYILSKDGKKLSRVRILATVVSVFESDDGQFTSITLDDGTDTIRVKTFKGMKLLKDAKVGDLVDVIGRVREYNGEIYIIPEIMHILDNPNYETLRMLEISKFEDEWKKKVELVKKFKEKMGDNLSNFLVEHHGFSDGEVESILEALGSEPQKEKENYEAKILQIIDELDEGEGALYSDIISKSGLPENVVDGVINQLLMDGICFEPRPGRIKKL